jgi:hypothetical protein
MHEAIEKTIKEYARMSASDLDTFARISDLHQVTADAISDIVRVITSIEENLRSKISWAQRDLQTAADALDAGHEINPCGVLQTNGQQIDVLAARRDDAYARLKAACRTAAALPVPDSH